MGELDAVAEYWEPWKPQVGQRVTVRPSLECQTTFKHVDLAGDYIQSRVGHAPGECGVRGTIVQHPSIVRQLSGHPYFVQFDEPIRTEGIIIYAAVYAAVELEPLEGER